jgi:NAD(P)-dependent dehydrogenase (short-subunit alcohol dehydrogenase family)
MAILVTGGTKGVGLAMAHRFAKPNADVFLNYRVDDARAEKARATIEGSGARFGANADAILAKQAAENPSGRNLGYDDYCSLIENLASPQAEMIQGQVIFVTGADT